MKRPQLNEEEIRKIVKANNVPQSKFPVCVVAVRGYYLDSMGKSGRNDRGIFDDAIFIVTPDNIFRFEANTDPSRYRRGVGYGSAKGMAKLKTGIHMFGSGWHKNHMAFRQCESFTVDRDKKGGGSYREKGWFGINFHRAGYSSTSSLGCQTIRRGYFKIARSIIMREMKKHGNIFGYNDWKQKVRLLPYILINETDRRKGHFAVSGRFSNETSTTA